jgi:hypothetical protein
MQFTMMVVPAAWTPPPETEAELPARLQSPILKVGELFQTAPPLCVAVFPLNSELYTVALVLDPLFMAPPKTAELRPNAQLK